MTIIIWLRVGTAARNNANGEGDLVHGYRQGDIFVQDTFYGDATR